MRRRFLSLALWLACSLAGTTAGTAQVGDAPLASLVADALRIEADRVLVAEGDVEIFYDGVRLTASRIVYDSAGDSIAIEGPIRLVESSGAVLLADAAELDSDLSDGILRSARLVLDQQLQLAAAEIVRDGARYTRLRRVVASSCQVCADNPTPLWEIRASGVVHDQIGQQLYFENAQLRVGGIPVFYLPRLRLPDPTLDRATGFLVPDLRTTSDLGTGVKLPYFIRIGDSADLTLTPYVSPATTTVEAGYRQVFATGALRFDGAYTFEDDILGGESRWFAFASGGFRLPRDFQLSFSIETVSDSAYLLDYDYSDKDRLESRIALQRVRDQSFTTAGLIRYETLRDAEIPIKDTLPEYVGELRHSRRLPVGGLGGDAWLTLDARVLTRPSDADVLGRDVGRIGAAVDWRRDWVGPAGLVFDVAAGLSLDAYRVENDSTFASSAARATPSAMVGLRWPLERTDGGGGRQLLEPVIQLAWSETSGEAVPNEDSLLVEFDEGNLFSLSRFPGEDVYEDGLRANIGLNWVRSLPGGTSYGLTLGRVLRFSETDQFADGTGLSGDTSDWLAAVRLEMGERLSLINRALFDDGLDVTRNETRLDWVEGWGSLSTSYLWSVAVPEENRPDPLSEWALSASYDFSPNWQGRLDWRYDLINDRAARAGAAVQYRNECIGVDLSVSRRFTSSASVSPTTSYSLRLSLNGFGTGNDGREFRRSCTG
jgi:LPS-assembly protein